MPLDVRVAAGAAQHCPGYHGRGLPPHAAPATGHFRGRPSKGAHASDHQTRRRETENGERAGPAAEGQGEIALVAAPQPSPDTY